MKAISLRNPFASLITLGYKTIETRTESSPVAKIMTRGDILLCTSAKPHQQWDFIKQHYLYNMDAVPIDPYMKIATDKLWEQSNHSWITFSQLLILPKEPSIVAVVRIVDVVKMTIEHQKAGCFSLFPGAKSVILDNVRPIIPVPLQGLTNGFHLGPFEVNINQSQLTFKQGKA